jgi:hypothetical protein
MLVIAKLIQHHQAASFGADGTIPYIMGKKMGRVGSTPPRITNSNIEENRLVLALHADIEAVQRLLAAALLVGNERPTAIRRHQRQNRVGGVGGLVGEIQPRVDLPQHAAREDADHGLPFGPGTAPGLMVSKLNTPALSVAERPKPVKVAFGRGFSPRAWA